MPHQAIPGRNRKLGKAMRRALTPAEFKLWRNIRSRSIEGLRFRCQAPLGPYIVDFFCPECRLIVEVDGGEHGRHYAALRDAERDAWLAREGHLVLRFTNNDVLSNVDGVIEGIVAAARLRTGRDPSPKPAVPVSALPQGEG